MVKKQEIWDSLTFFISLWNALHIPNRAFVFYAPSIFSFYFFSHIFLQNFQDTRSLNISSFIKRINNPHIVVKQGQI